VTRSNGSHPDDPLDELDDVIAELEGSEWDDEITAEHLLEAVKAGAAAATGKHQAIAAETPTRPDHRPPDSTPPKLKLFDPARIDTAPKAVAFVALLVAVVALAIWGPGWMRDVLAP
jgi:Fe-S-cluster formation regulator IscX/YfhJ